MMYVYVYHVQISYVSLLSFFDPNFIMFYVLTLFIQSFKYMAEFIKDYSIEARVRRNSAVQGVSNTDYPAYVVVFLIHILAHDRGFPPEDCKDEGIIAQFFW